MAGFVQWWKGAVAELCLFERRRGCRVSRKSFWLTLAAYAVISLLAFEIPFETAYQLEMEPDSVFVRAAVYGFAVLQFVIAVCLWRLAGGRLIDAGLSPAWRWLVLVPAAGWLLLAWMLALERAGPGRFDRLPSGN